MDCKNYHKVFFIFLTDIILYELKFNELALYKDNI